MDAFSPYIITIVLAWIASQGAKYCFAVAKSGSFRHIRSLYSSGNMPSAHSATVVSLATLIGLNEGIDSALFGLASLFALIVMYDAVMVRRSSGEQGKAIRELIREQKSSVSVPRAAKGHTPVEVAVGACIGVALGIIVFLATK